MPEYVLTLLAAAAVTYLLTPLVRRFAIAVGAMHAARDRDVHVVPTPLLGGFAMYAGLAAGLLVASRLAALNSAFEDTNMAKGLLLAGGLVVVMGFVDDRWRMGALSKLAGQVAAGMILVWSGAEVTWLPEPGGGTLGLTSDQQTAATILVVVVTINAVNFIDGLDGLAAGIVGTGAGAFFIYYYTLTHRLGLAEQSGPALASAVLAGICLGFLPHNFHPARIFMGDTGSMLIGLLLAYAPISSLASLDPGSLTDYASGTVNRFGEILPLLLPAAIMLIPYSDLLMAVVRRTRAGMSPFAPDRQHLHHRLLAIGHSHRASVLIMYLWASLFSGSVVWLSIVRTPLFVLAIVTVAAMLLLLLVSMPRLRLWSRPAAGGAAAPPAVSATRPAMPAPALGGTGPGDLTAGPEGWAGAPAASMASAAAAPWHASPLAGARSAGLALPGRRESGRRPAAPAETGPPPAAEPAMPLGSRPGLGQGAWSGPGAGGLGRGAGWGEAPGGEPGAGPLGGSGGLEPDAGWNGLGSGSGWFAGGAGGGLGSGMPSDSGLEGEAPTGPLAGRAGGSQLETSGNPPGGDISGGAAYGAEGEPAGFDALDLDATRPVPVLPHRMSRPPSVPRRAGQPSRPRSTPPSAQS